MTNVIIDPDAGADIGEICDWYEAQRAGLSLQFLEELNATIIAIGQLPESFPLITRNARRALLHRFPYFAIFIQSGDDIGVVGVFHSARNPKTWLRRAKRHGG